MCSNQLSKRFCCTRLVAEMLLEMPAQPCKENLTYEPCGRCIPKMLISDQCDSMGSFSSAESLHAKGRNRKHQWAKRCLRKLSFPVPTKSFSERHCEDSEAADLFPFARAGTVPDANCKNPDQEDAFQGIHKKDNGRNTTRTSERTGERKGEEGHSQTHVIRISTCRSFSC
jgi:hypothetical protein